MKKRAPAVAGQFYPGDGDRARRMISEMVVKADLKRSAIGVMGPHAGWMYSGKGAGILYGSVEIPGRVIVLCPNHRGVGAKAAVMSEGSWVLPTGETELDKDMGSRIKARTGLLIEDERAHAGEHSLEVHVPFLQYFRPDFKLTPISLGRLSYSECLDLGGALAGAAEEAGEETLVVASSDMTHFESAESARKKDDLALARIKALDPKGLYEVVLGKRITMCGVIPASVMLIYALERGATSAEVIDYRNSGDVTGDYGDVVAYASAVVT